MERRSEGTVRSMSLAIDHPGPWTVDDVLALPEDGRHTRYELLDGSLVVTPAPAFDHQLVVGRLFRRLAEAAELDAQVIQGVNVEVPSGLLIPDICCVSAEVARERPTLIPAAGVIAAIEVVSPSSQRMDRMIKPSVYAEAGIAAYWRVELKPEPVVSISTLQNGLFVEVETARSGAASTITIPFPIILDPQDLVR
jgi:Uma2 family endonuclease